MHEFEYVAVQTLDEATSLLAERKGDVRLLAGGTDLIVNMRVGRRSPGVVIDAKKIDELRQLELGDAGLSIGAAVSCREIWENDAIRKAYPALIDSASLIGGVQIQGRASIGGNLCNAAPSADAVPTLIAYGAIAHIQSASGERQLPVEEICTGPGQNALADDELLVKITLPAPATNSGAGFLRFIPRNEMDIAVANVASWVELDDSGKEFKSARVATGAVAPIPLYVEEAGAALSGKAVNDENIAEAARIAMEAAKPITDMRGTEAHRKQLVEVLTRRTLGIAVSRARGESS